MRPTCAWAEGYEGYNVGNMGAEGAKCKHHAVRTSSTIGASKLPFFDRSLPLKMNVVVKKAAPVDQSNPALKH